MAGDGTRQETGVHQRQTSSTIMPPKTKLQKKLLYHQATSVLKFLEENNFGNAALLLKRQIKTDFGEIPARLQGNWDWVADSDYVEEEEDEDLVDELSSLNVKDAGLASNDTSCEADNEDDSSEEESSSEGESSSEEDESSEEEESSSEEESSEEESSEEEESDDDDQDDENKDKSIVAPPPPAASGDVHKDALIELEDSSSSESDTEVASKKNIKPKAKEKPVRKTRVSFSDDEDEIHIISPLAKRKLKKGDLHYSKMDIRRFRQEHEEEKLNELIAATSSTMGLGSWSLNKKN